MKTEMMHRHSLRIVLPNLGNSILTSDYSITYLRIILIKSTDLVANSFLTLIQSDERLNPEEFLDLCKLLFQDEKGKSYPIDKKTLEPAFKLFDFDGVDRSFNSILLLVSHYLNLIDNSLTSNL